MLMSKVALIVSMMIAVVAVGSDSEPPTTGVFRVSLDAYNVSHGRHVRCAAEVLSSLDWFVAPETRSINATTSVVTGASPVNLPFQFSGPTPFDVLYRGCCGPLPGVSSSSVLALMAAYNATGSQFSAEVIHVIRSGDSNVSTPAQRRFLCLVACASIGFHTSREVLVGGGDNGVDGYCGCAPVGSVTAVFGNTTFQSAVPEGACLHQDGVSVYEMDLYCFPTSVNWQWCNSGCQPRGLDACCYPGIFVPSENTTRASPAPNSGSMTDDSSSGESLQQSNDVDYYLQVALLSLLSFAVVEGIGFWIWLRCCSSSSRSSAIAASTSSRRRKRDSSAGGGGGRGESDWVAALTANSGTTRRLNDMETELLTASVMQQCEAPVEEEDGSSRGSAAAVFASHLNNDSMLNLVPFPSGGNNYGNVTGSAGDIACSDLERALFGDATHIVGVRTNSTLSHVASAPTASLTAATRGDVPMGEGCCPICLDVCASPPSSQTTHLHCGHLVHRVCFKDYVKHRVRENSQKPIKCPVFGCTGLNASAADTLL